MPSMLSLVFLSYVRRRTKGEPTLDRLICQQRIKKSGERSAGRLTEQSRTETEGRLLPGSQLESQPQRGLSPRGSEKDAGAHARGDGRRTQAGQDCPQMGRLQSAYRGC
jgi:hypothetical protein